MLIRWGSDVAPDSRGLSWTASTPQRKGISWAALSRLYCWRSLIPETTVWGSKLGGDAPPERIDPIPSSETDSPCVSTSKLSAIEDADGSNVLISTCAIWATFWRSVSDSTVSSTISGVPSSRPPGSPSSSSAATPAPAVGAAVAVTVPVAFINVLRDAFGCSLPHLFFCYFRRTLVAIDPKERPCDSSRSEGYPVLRRSARSKKRLL